MEGTKVFFSLQALHKKEAILINTYTYPSPCPNILNLPAWSNILCFKIYWEYDVTYTTFWLMYRSCLILFVDNQFMHCKLKVILDWKIVCYLTSVVIAYKALKVNKVWWKVKRMSNSVQKVNVWKSQLVKLDLVTDTVASHKDFVFKVSCFLLSEWIRHNRL